MYTKSLFWEFGLDREKAIFTITNTEKDGLVPFKPLYIKYAAPDPTEYSFAQEVFGSWDHWQKILGNRKILEFIEVCREERDIVIESLAVQEIIKEAESGKSRFQAAKYLVEKGYLKDIPKTVRNRTQRQESNRLEDIMSEDLKRLVNG